MRNSHELCGNYRINNNKTIVKENQNEKNLIYFTRPINIKNKNSK